MNVLGCVWFLNGCTINRLRYENACYFDLKWFKDSCIRIIMSLFISLSDCSNNKKKKPGQFYLIPRQSVMNKIIGDKWIISHSWRLEMLTLFIFKYFK